MALSAMNYLLIIYFTGIHQRNPVVEG